MVIVKYWMENCSFVLKKLNFERKYVYLIEIYVYMNSEFDLTWKKFWWRFYIIYFNHTKYVFENGSWYFWYEDNKMDGLKLIKIGILFYKVENLH